MYVCCVGVDGSVLWGWVLCVCRGGGVVCVGVGECCVCVVWEWVEVCMLCGGGDILMGDITGLEIIIALWECQDIHMTQE